MLQHSKLSARPAPRASRAGVLARPAKGLGSPLRPAVLPIAPTHIVAAQAAADELDTRLFRRTVADSEFWARHRTQDRYTKNVLSIPSSRIIRGLATPLAWVATVATAVCIYETAIQNGTLPNTLPTFLLPSAQPQVLTSFAVSLLLVFRTNQSYDRWWEARKVWGSILNRSRDIVNQCVVFFPSDEKRLQHACARWTWAFTRALQAQLQDGVDLRKTLGHALTPEELDMLMGSSHKVVKSLSVLSEIIKQANLPPLQQQLMMLNVQMFYDLLGMCERIYRTPLPLTYTRHTSRFLIIWLTTLPFGEWNAFGWGTIPITLLIGALLLGIDEIGVQIEEPFGVLPLDVICNRAELDGRQLLAEQGQAEEYTETLLTSKVKQPVLAKTAAPF